MKKVVRCLNCRKVVRELGSFKVKLLDRLESPLTGEIKEAEVKGVLCRECAHNAGYKVKGISGEVEEIAKAIKRAGRR